MKILLDDQALRLGTQTIINTSMAYRMAKT